MIHFQAPILVKIRDSIKVNVSLSVSHAIERALPQTKIKDEIAKKIKDDTLKRTLTKDDYEETEKCDTISFWFIGGTSLSYRVGHEIKQADFERVVSHLDSLTYRTPKNDGKPSDKQTSSST